MCLLFIKNYVSHIHFDKLNMINKSKIKLLRQINKGDDHNMNKLLKSNNNLNILKKQQYTCKNISYY